MGKKLVNVKKHPTKDMYIHSYTKAAFYKKAWNEDTINSRGHVYDSNGNIISCPFPKFFNIDENEMSRIDDVVSTMRENIDDLTEWEKFNGHLCIVFHDGEKWINTTRGSFESDFVDLDKIVLEESGYTEIFFDEFSPKKNDTFMFEIIADYDPHFMTELTKEMYVGSEDHAILIGINNNITKDSVPFWWIDVRNTFGILKEKGKIDDDFEEPYIPEPNKLSKLKYLVNDAETILEKEDLIKCYLDSLKEERTHTEGVILEIPSKSWRVKVKTDWFMKGRYKFQFNSSRTKDIFKKYEDSEEAFSKIPEEFHSEYREIFDDYLIFTSTYQEQLMSMAENLSKAFVTRDTIFAYLDRTDELNDLEKKAAKSFYMNKGLQACIMDLFVANYRKFSLVERYNSKEKQCSLS